MVSKFQWKPFWLATQRDPQNDRTATQNRVKYDVFAQGPIQRKSWSNVPLKLFACIGFLYKVLHKIGRLRKFNRACKIEVNFLTTWTISMIFGKCKHVSQVITTAHAHKSGVSFHVHVFQDL